MLFGSDSEFIVITVMPDLSHVVPIDNDAMLDRVLDVKNALLLLSLLADIGVLLIHPNHDTWNFRPANNG